MLAFLTPLPTPPGRTILKKPSLIRFNKVKNVTLLRAIRHFLNVRLPRSFSLKYNHTVKGPTHFPLKSDF